MPKLPGTPWIVLGSGDTARASGQVQGALDAARQTLNSQPFVASDGAQVTATLTSAADTTVAHKLGRKLTGWLVLRVTGGPASVYEVTSDANVVKFHNSGAADSTITFWFF